MEEFLKIDWPPKETPQPESVFVSEQFMQGSYVFNDLSSDSSDSEHTESLNDSNYTPGKVYFVQGKHSSKLSKKEHFECLHALKILQAKSTKKSSISPYDQLCITTYNGLRSTIIEENSLFLKHAQKQWKYTNLIPIEKYMFIVNLWKQQLRRCLAYKRYYKGCDNLSLACFEDEDYVEVVHLKNVLELGHLAKFTPPMIKSKCFLNINFSDEDTMFTLNSKLPVSQDRNISKLAQHNAFQLVISSSALKRLMDCDNWNYDWDIPVIIKTERGKKIVFVDKTLPQKAPTVRQLNEKLYKNGLKANFCYFKMLRPTYILVLNILKK
ncbi:uncharacterized protein LOC108737678 [Agrilus planipennis]|uniref:Uncharacterized protein LOC108737678 n=1 Tax=Agrilus planipennis TaxID=224129 RepID=A0A7F5REJ1_AGRPL|nr:uncharacterized protein LOC108737678 [Agrilus planipennis]